MAIFKHYPKGSIVGSGEYVFRHFLDEQPPDLNNYLCFTAEEAGSTVAMSAFGSAPSISLEYSSNKQTWTPFVVGTTTITLTNVGDKVYLRGDNIQFATNSLKYNHFVMSGKIAASGNIMSLLDKTVESLSFNRSYALSSIFDSCTSITSAPELPATTLTSYCYEKMFYNCTSLTSAPELPATALEPCCYSGMFYGCTSLTSAPKLLAKTLPSYCYQLMFYNCTKLKLSETKDSTYTTRYRIPYTGSGTETLGALDSMFLNTGGTFTGTPRINKTYYGAW